MYQQQMQQFQVQEQQQQDLIDCQQLQKMCCVFPPSAYSQGSVLRLVTHPGQKEDPSDELAAVIISLCESQSYDQLFTSVPQQSAEGTSVRVYQAGMKDIFDIVQCLEGKETQNQEENSESSILQQVISDIKKVDPESVVFNWECCSQFSSEGFQNNNDQVFKSIKFLIESKFFLMFSDFSLKALIAQWQEEYLGPNPFVKLGEIQSGFDLKFDKNTLVNCPSAQLQKVGELSEHNYCHVHALGGTILYTVDFSKTDTDKYTLQVLTVVDKADSQEVVQKCQNNSQICQIENHKGSAGHVLLNYPSGGKILTSMGHWIELMQLDTNMEQLLKVAEKNYGAEYVQKMQCEYQNLSSTIEQQNYFDSKAAQFVQQSAPCAYSKKC